MAAVCLCVYCVSYPKLPRSLKLTYAMENTKTLHALDEFTKNKPKDIPKELDEYLRHVAASGDPVYQWSLVKFLFRQKLLNVIMDFYESCPMMDIPVSPNLDPFNFETIKKRLLDRYDLFAGVPFTIQRIAELLTAPRKQYSRLDKYMRALEKNVWVVSTRDPATREPTDELLVNGALSTDAHPEENDAEDLQGGETEELDEPVLDEDCPKTNDVSDNDQDPPEALLVEPIEAIAELEPVESLPSSESNSLEAPENVTVELPSSETVTGTDTDTDIDDKSEETSNEEPITEPDSTVGDQPPTDTEKTDQVAIEITQAAEEEPIAESVENREPAKVADPLIAEQPEESEEESFRTGVKRKCEDVEEASPSKKIGTEPTEPEALEETPIAIEEKTAEVNVTDLPEIREVEVSMDSTEVAEEKVAMVVEEPELAMEVDETSIQSPMAQEDAVEAMEESELAIS